MGLAVGHVQEFHLDGRGFRGRRAGGGFGPQAAVAENLLDLGSVTAGLLARLDNEAFKHLRNQVTKAEQKRLDADIAALEAQLEQKRKLRDAPPG